MKRKGRSSRRIKGSVGRGGRLKRVRRKVGRRWGERKENEEERMKRRR